jgi:hypothetical protein
VLATEISSHLFINTMLKKSSSTEDYMRNALISGLEDCGEIGAELDKEL